jgi:uncharacterized protein YcfJ
MKSIFTVIIASVLVLSGGGCANMQESGTGIGALTGAGLGVVLGNQLGHGAARGRSQLVGGAIGAGVGGLLGNQWGQGRDFQTQQVAQQGQTQAQMAQMQAQLNSVTVNVTNSNGSITPVTLMRSGTGFVGPRGEFYGAMPSESQLKVYGF